MLEELLNDIAKRTRGDQKLCVTLKYDMSIAYMHGHSDRQYNWSAEVYWRPGDRRFFAYGDCPEMAIRVALNELNSEDN